MTRAKANGVAPGWLLYNPLHHLKTQYGTDRAAKFAAGAEKALDARGIAQPLWSAADEPSNPDQDSAELRNWITALRTQGGPRLRIAGHLNAPGDKEFVSLFDTVIINPGFGIDRNNIAQIASNNRDVWIYNTWAPRLTAGIWLNTTKATRYVQWHARMPTANPLDPLDGREGDAQMLYPAQQTCPDTPDINRALLQLAEGVVDQRWLLWLQAQPDGTAISLAKSIHNRIPKAWTDATQWSAADLNSIRDQILQLARNR